MVDLQGIAHRMGLRRRPDERKMARNEVSSKASSKQTTVRITRHGNSANQADIHAKIRNKKIPRKRKRKETYSNYIYKVHPDPGVSSKAMSLTNEANYDFNDDYDHGGAEIDKRIDDTVKKVR